MLARQQEGAGWSLNLFVDDTKMLAHAKLERSVPAATCTLEEALAFLRASQLSICAQSPDAAQRLAQLILSRPDEAVVVAEGTPVTAARCDLEWRVPLTAHRHLDESQSMVDVHEVTQFVNVTAGQVLCEIVSTPAAPARDVFGAVVADASLPTGVPNQPTIELGEHVEKRADNQDIIVAVEEGCVRYQDGVLSVQQLLEVRGDVDFRIGNIDYHGRVIVSGDVLAGFKITATGDVVVKGMVENASIESGGDIVIKGGAACRHGTSHLKAEGSVQVHYLHMTRVDCNRDLRVAVECIDSEIMVGGNVTVTKGGIIGGKLSANGSVRAPNLGCEMCVPTSISVGDDQTVVADHLLHANVTVQIGSKAPHRIAAQIKGPIRVSVESETGAILVGPVPASPPR